MQERLLRTTAVLGTENTLKLSEFRVVIAGLGGVGGYTLEALARMGIMNFTLIDSDCFEISNLNRQLLATTESLNKPKVDAAKERLNKIDPDINIVTKKVFIDESNINEVFEKNPDIVIDAIDSVPSKCLLLSECIKRNIKVVSSMGAALRKEPTRIKTDDISKTYGCPLAKQVRQTLKDYNITNGIPCVFSPEPKTQPDPNTLGSLVTVVGCFGLTLAQLAIDTLLKTK